jgi:hypothetical protein
MRWEVRLDGPSALLHQLALTIAEWDIRVVNREGAFLLCGARLDSQDDAGRVRREAERIVTLLSASARLSLGSTVPLRIADVAAAAPGTTADSPPAPDQWSRRSSLSASMRAALSNPTLEQALRLRNSGELNWSDMLRMYSLIEEAAGGKPSLSASGGTHAAIAQLLQTARCFTDVEWTSERGRSARRLSNPMTLAEARSFVDRLLIALIVSGSRRRARRRLARARRGRDACTRRPPSSRKRHAGPQ